MFDLSRIGRAIGLTVGAAATLAGVGAVAAAMAMPLINRLLGPDRANIWAMGVHAVATLIAALVMTPGVRSAPA
ncbi:MAG: hypothetical protein HC822_27750, partial [Oscillochloris sp.]|nr:hypothetical protein [Oscillochloris sp.]